MKTRFLIRVEMEERNIRVKKSFVTRNVKGAVAREGKKTAINKLRPSFEMKGSLPTSITTKEVAISQQRLDALLCIYLSHHCSIQTFEEGSNFSDPCLLM